MRYLVAQEGYEPFLTNYYLYENHYVEGSVIYDLIEYTYTTDGKHWEPIPEDHL